ncbi:MAG: RsmB/NOP family class I SAM-dependent RNA methyltransferase [Pseudomonadota bacterium]
MTPTPAARRGAPAGLDARAAALGLLRAVFGDNRPMDDAMAAGEYAALPERDRAFAARLARTACRRLTDLDAAVDAHVKRPPPLPARLILRLGAAELTDAQAAPYAAVNAAVTLAKTKGAPRQAAMINAVLRRIGERRDQIGTGAPPVWLRDATTRDFGAAAADGVAAALATERPPLDMTALHPIAAPPGAVALGRNRYRFDPPPALIAVPGFTDGALQVQDAAAAIPALILGDLVGADARLADLCAAPGGKTAQLAARGATVWAVDRSEKRLDRLRENMLRIGVADRVRAARGDATTWKPPEPLDGVLIDAPCTATGTLRRHPDVVWTKRPKDAAALADAQDALIDAGLRALRPGGVVVYAVCSLLAMEGEERMAAAYARYPQLTPAPIDPAAFDLPAAAAAANGALRVLPHHWADRGGVDGFYIAAARLAA